SATGLAQRPFVYVLDRKGQVRVDRMVFAVDDVTDSADRKAKRVRRAGGVEEQPVVDLALPAPEEGPDQPAENAAPLAKAAFLDKDDLLPCVAELPVVLPHVEQARPDQAGDHHPDRQVVHPVGRNAFGFEQDLSHTCGGEDAEHAEDPVPGDQEGADLEQVWIEVDDNGREHHPSTLLILASASDFGSRARVYSSGGEILPATDSRIGV